MKTWRHFNLLTLSYYASFLRTFFSLQLSQISNCKTVEHCDEKYDFIMS